MPPRRCGWACWNLEPPRARWTPPRRFAARSSLESLTSHWCCAEVRTQQLTRCSRLCSSRGPKRAELRCSLAGDDTLPYPTRCTAPACDPPATDLFEENRREEREGEQEEKNRRGKEAGEQEGGTESGVSRGRRCPIVIGVMRGPPT